MIKVMTKATTIMVIISNVSLKSFILMKVIENNVIDQGVISKPNCKATYLSIARNFVHIYNYSATYRTNTILMTISRRKWWISLLCSCDICAMSQHLICLDLLKSLDSDHAAALPWSLVSRINRNPNFIYV